MPRHVCAYSCIDSDFKFVEKGRCQADAGRPNHYTKIHTAAGGTGDWCKDACSQAPACTAYEYDTAKFVCAVFTSGDNSFSADSSWTYELGTSAATGTKITKGDGAVAVNCYVRILSGPLPICKEDEYLSEARVCTPDTKCTQPDTFLQKEWTWGAETKMHSCNKVLDSNKFYNTFDEAIRKCKWRQECVAIQTYTDSTYGNLYFFYLCGGIDVTTASAYDYAIITKLNGAPGTCSNCTQCPVATYRTGSCKGATDAYKCNKQPVCRDSQTLRGATATRAGVCSSFELCACEKQYMSSPPKQGAACLNELECATGEYLKKASAMGNEEKGYMCAHSVPNTYSGAEDQIKAACHRTASCSGYECYTSRYHGYGTTCTQCKTFKKYTGSSSTYDSGYYYRIVPKLPLGTAMGKCETCSNSQCGASQHKSGSCSGTTNGFTCLNKVKCGKDQYRLSVSNTCLPRPRCTALQFLIGAKEDAPGVCTAHPNCQDNEYLEKKAYTKVAKRMCSHHTSVPTYVRKVAVCLPVTIYFARIVQQ